jgi:hypothetical protein
MARIKKLDTSEIKVVKKMRNYDNDPYFKEKDARAKAFLKKNGLPFQNKASSLKQKYQCHGKRSQINMG